MFLQGVYNLPNHVQFLSEIREFPKSKAKSRNPSRNPEISNEILKSLSWKSKINHKKLLKQLDILIENPEITNEIQISVTIIEIPRDIPVLGGSKKLLLPRSLSNVIKSCRCC